MNYSEVKERVRPRFLSIEKGTTEDLIKELDTIGLLYRRYLDMVIGFVILSDLKNPFRDGKEVYEDMLKDWNVSADELYKVAVSNLQKDGYGLAMGSNPDGEGNPNIKFGTVASPDYEMVAFTNRYYTCGAVGILDVNMTKKFFGNSKWYVMPSSVDELMFIRCHDKDDYEPEQLKMIVELVNDDVIKDQAVLSNSIYIWDDGKLEVVA